MTSANPQTSRSFEDLALDLAWGAWIELGVPGTTSTHGDWAIDPEPLILFTAFLDDTDRRLRDEATAWCIRHTSMVSKARLRALLRDTPASVREPFGVLAATVQEHTNTAWPGATTARPSRAPRPDGAGPLDVSRPATCWLRLRSVVGVNARAEILRFLSSEQTVAPAAHLARAIGFGKRAVLDECSSLERAGVLAIRTIGNRNYYALARREALFELIGGVAGIKPDWTAVFEIARELVVIERLVHAPDALAAARPVKVRKALDALEQAQDRLDLPRPGRGLRGEELWPALQAFGHQHLGEWAAGRPSGHRFR